MTDERRAKIQRIIDDLRGSADSIDQAFEDEDLDFETAAREETNLIDEQIFLCESCGWWCDADEESEKTPQTCDDCA